MKRSFALAAALLVFALLLRFSAVAAESCRYALGLCGELILPSLFPFFVLSILLSRLGLPEALGRLLAPTAARLYGVSGAGASALIVGLTGGYPMGAAYIAGMVKGGIVSPAEAERLLGFCNNSGPAFIIGAVGLGVFRSAGTGLLLYAVHILSALLTGLFFRGRSAVPSVPSVPVRRTAMDGVDSPLPAAVREAAASVINICGYIVCFTVLAGLLDAGGGLTALCALLSRLTGLESGLFKAGLTGVLELGSAVGAMQGLERGPASLALAAGLLSFGGLSVHFQTRAVLAESEIKGVLHFTGRLISAAIAAALGHLAGTLVF